ncbi:MAG: cupredoxin domain-containing protein [Candidatus Magasanikbacteria bacterium]|nr:cupredoxin domain-containing protein [Candidatus Magasanikbacteria bacterium]
MYKRISGLAMVIGAVVLLGAGCSKGSLLSNKDKQPIEPAISVSPQALEENNEILVNEASLPEDGWIAIHTKENGQMGEIIGYTFLAAGKDSKIKITVDRNKVTPSLVAMLHYDRDPKGTFESPGSDGPVIKDQQVILKEFAILNQSELIKEFELSKPTSTSNDDTPKPTPPTSQGTRKEFVITAKQWSFSPATIKVKKGDRVVLKVTSTDVSHGLNLPAFNINETLEPGVTKTVEFVADKVGTFTFSCSVMCGTGHKAMTGTLVVE